MANQNDAYQKIAEMWAFPESKSFRKMLEALMTKEDEGSLDRERMHGVRRLCCRL